MVNLKIRCRDVVEAVMVLVCVGMYLDGSFRFHALLAVSSG